MLPSDSFWSFKSMSCLERTFFHLLNEYMLILLYFVRKGRYSIIYYSNCVFNSPCPTGTPQNLQYMLILPKAYHKPQQHIKNYLERDLPVGYVQMSLAACLESHEFQDIQWITTSYSQAIWAIWVKMYNLNFPKRPGRPEIWGLLMSAAYFYKLKKRLQVYLGHVPP